MSLVKKIGKKIIEGGVELVKDSTTQLGKTVSPEEMLKQVTGAQGKGGSELGDYLKNVGPNLSEEEIKKKSEELGMSDQKDIENARKIIQATIPAHMKLPQKPAEPRPYESTVQDEERKKALAIEAQRKQPVVTPIGKQSRGMFGKKRIKSSTSFESKQNVKIG